LRRQKDTVCPGNSADHSNGLSIELNMLYLPPTGEPMPDSAASSLVLAEDESIFVITDADAVR